ncbi:alpha-L-rhamnosidase [Butyrivibrio sp. WCE2006]|uniref:alpha-L-rhamnosidase n=1 Tax=Butyrivibrio sp. WCE2006 TaxID=1410611 RepID=UPI0006786027
MSYKKAISGSTKGEGASFMGLKIIDCKTEYRTNPLGIDSKKPRFSWKIESDKDNTLQKNYRLEVTRTDGTVIWDSGEVEDSGMSEVVYEGIKLKAGTTYYWTVKTADNHGQTAESGKNFFETGFMDESPESFGGAKWIGPSKYNLSSDVRGVFGLKVRFKFDDESNRFGVIFGRGDKRIKDRDNYFKYEIDCSEEPYKLKIYRVGIAPEDREDVPYAEVNICDYDDKDKNPIISKDNLYDEHVIDIQVMGNSAYALIDEKRVDVTVTKTFFGEMEAPRVLNPLGDNDVNTYPRLNDIGFFVPKGQGVTVNRIEVRNLRKPYGIVYLDTKTYHINPMQASNDSSSILLSTKDSDAVITKNPSHTSIPMLRSIFRVESKKLAKARLYATARGIYECSVNGKPVTDTWFNPGQTQYDRHMMYQTYDITDMLSEGENAIGVILASGWWSDAQTFVLGNYNYYGDRESFLGRIELEYEDGSVQNYETNTSDWKYYDEGPWTYAGFFHGEHYDANKYPGIKGFDTPEYDDSKWMKPDVIPVIQIRKSETMSKGPMQWPEVNLTEPSFIGQIGDGIRVSYELTAKSVTEIEKGIYIYDMGVNVAGVPRLHLYGEKGQVATLRYAELLYPDIAEFAGKTGTLMVENLRDADCTDLYTFAGDEGGEDYTPKFTFRGYRYIEISGVTKKPELSEVKMLVLSSAYDMSSSLETSDELTNKFIDNVRRSQQSNFIGIPTDCPQRNERMGWDGDTSIFARTATFNADTRMFYENWLMAMRDLQEENGKYPDIAPVGGGFGGYTYESSALHVTYELFQQYGDIQVIRDNIEAMKLFMNYSEKMWAEGNLAGGFTLGDWLAPEETDLGLICHAFYGYNAYVMSKMARAIGDDKYADAYGSLYDELKTSFNDKYFDYKTGKTADHTQCSYALPLAFKMVKDEFVQKVGDRLSEKTRETGHLVKTGFFGTAPLNPMLTMTGHEDDAFKLMTQTACPSWLYPVTQGATSIWERWDSFTIENGFGGHNSMNSFNHYSLGAVLEWFYMYVLGIQRDEDMPGYRHFYVKPCINTAYEYVKGHFTSPYGVIKAEWKHDRETGKYTYLLEVPAGASATICLEDKATKVGSGHHEFTLT